MRKMKKRITAAYKWILYAAAAWILASCGVNGTANPARYLRALTMHQQILPVSVSQDGSTVFFPEDRKYEWLAFQADDADAYFFDAPVCGLTSQGEEACVISFAKGVNTLALPASWTGIRFPPELAADQHLVLGEVMLTESKILSVQKTLYLTVSFFLRVGFWECLQWIKRRYTG